MEDEKGDASEPLPESLAEAFTAAMNSLPSGPPPPLTLWWSLSRPDGGGVHLKVQDIGADGDMWVVTDVYVHGPGVTASALQQVPVSQLSVMMNLFAGWDPATIGEAAEAEMGQRVLIDPEREPSLAELRQRAERAPARLPVPSSPQRPRLTRPDGSDPDGFAERVAAAYREYATQTRAPAVEIANEARVPVATARSWIREARRRGKLPAGRRGKAG